MSTDTAWIGKTLKLLRVHAGKQQQELARELGITPNYLSLIENGSREPSIRFLKKFRDTLNVPLGYYLWLAGPKG